MPPKNIKKNPEVKIRHFVEKEEGQEEYGLVCRKLGGGRFAVRLNMQNREIIAKVRGKFKKGAQKKENFVDIDTVVLVSFRDFQDKIGDIVHVYTPAEVRQLKKDGKFVEESVRPAGEDGEIADTVEDDTFNFEEI